jgi:hypothetical protein
MADEKAYLMEEVIEPRVYTAWKAGDFKRVVDTPLKGECLESQEVKEPPYGKKEEERKSPQGEEEDDDPRRQKGERYILSVHGKP